MAVPVKKIIPTSFEMVVLFMFTIAIVFLGSSKTLLDTYGLNSSTAVVQQTTSQVVSHGLSILDGFSATTQIVTFMIWAFVGVLCFSIVQSVSGAYREVREERAIAYGKYVRPSTFTTSGFWRQVLLDFTLLFCSLAVTGIILYGFLTVVLPVTLNYSHGLLKHASFGALGGFLISIVWVYVWLLLLDASIRIILHRHELVA